MQARRLRPPAQHLYIGRIGAADGLATPMLPKHGRQAVTTKTGDNRNAWDTPLRVLIWGGAAALLALPAIAMSFTREVNWDAFDFFVFGAMLAAACGICELVLRAGGSFLYRAAAATAIGAAFLLIWINLAVGVIGDEDNPANLMFMGVIATALLGGFAVRGRSAQMSSVMASTAALHAAAGVVALAAGWGMGSAAWPWDVIGTTIVFTGLWLASAALFRRAAQ